MNPTLKRIAALHHIILFIILVCSGYLIFKNLGSAALWDDEAATAIVARNFLKTGQFTAWDGRNLFATRNGTSLQMDLIDHAQPVQCALTALSFFLFGESTFAARLPMAIIGLFAVILLYATLRRETPEYPAFALYATAVLGLVPEYILYYRNCRYFSVVCFAALLTFFAYRNFIRRPDAKWAAATTAAAIALYYSHFQICLAFLIPLAAIHLLFEQKRLPEKHWFLVAAGCFAFVLATLPYTVFHHLWERPDLPSVASLADRATIALWYLQDSFGSGIAPWALVVTTLVMLMMRAYNSRISRIVMQSLFIVVVHIVILSLTSMQGTAKEYPLANIRYCVACFPFTAILAAGIVHRVHQKNRFVAPALALLLIGSNLAYCLPWKNAKYQFPHPLVYSPLFEYIKEIHHPFHTGIGSAAEFLLKNGQKDETFYTVPDYFNAPLQFYVGSKMINSCGLDTTTRLGAQRMRSLSPYLFKEEIFPDWLVLFGMSKLSQEAVQYFSRAIDSQGTPVTHVYEDLFNIPINCVQLNRPEIFLHHFGEIADTNPRDNVLLFHKVNNDPAYWVRHAAGILGAAQASGNRKLAAAITNKLRDMYRADSAAAGTSSNENAAAVQNNIGFVCENEGKIGDAAAHYLEAVRLNPYDDKAHFNFANMCVRLGRLDEAIVHYRESLRINPGVARAHNNFGIILAQGGKVDEAIHHFKEALRLEPDLQDVKKNLNHAMRLLENK